MSRFSTFKISLLLVIPFATQAAEVEEITVIGVKDTTVVRITDTLVSPPDTAALLKIMPGANLNKNGELTGIAQYRGMFGDRINVTIDGAPVGSGGPNAMDAPLHYMPVAILESLTVRRGIAPVSAGQETIGGHMEAVPFKGNFGSTEKFIPNFRVYTGAQSVNDGGVLSFQGTLANQDHLFRANILTEAADDSRVPQGHILPSEYRRDRFDLGYSFQGNANLLSVDAAVNRTGNAGTPALPMDIRFIDSTLANAHWKMEQGDYTFSSSISWNDIEHEMTNFHLRRPPQDLPMMPSAMRYRQTLAESQNGGAEFALERKTGNGLWRLGMDTYFAGHDAKITNPNAGMFYIDNFKDVKRDVTGVFVEGEASLSASIVLETGLRVNQVKMNAGEVSANLNPMNMVAGMPFMLNNMAGMLADDFNASQRKQTDHNVDWFARTDFHYSDDVKLYAGLARKSRSPSYQERYLWLPMQSTGGLADGMIYVGDVNLKPEVAHEFELGMDLLGSKTNVYPRIFYKHIDDYIQGVPGTDILAGNIAAMMGNMGMGNGSYLQYSNVEAAIYGFDLESDMALSDTFTLRAILSIVRGERKDIEDNLYRISPDNLLLALDYSFSNWLLSIESVLYAKQGKVSATNIEQETPGYGQINLSSRLFLKDGLEIGLGINNLFDKAYRDHLSGYNRAINPDIALGERLPGLGRNVYARLIWSF